MQGTADGHQSKTTAHTYKLTQSDAEKKQLIEEQISELSM